MTDAAVLFEAIEKNDRGAVDALLRGSPSLASARNAGGLSPLMVSLYYGRPEIARRLIDSGIVPDLFEAAASGDSARVEEIVREDSSVVNTFSPDGFTPLALAAFFGHPLVVEFLLTAGADPALAAPNTSGVAPLHSAAAHSRPSVAFVIAKQLLVHGANVNARQEGGWTALHQAAAAGNDELVELLLACGADRTAQSVDGKTPLDLAEAKKHDRTAGLLKSVHFGENE